MQQYPLPRLPRLLLAGLSGGSGKTIATLGLIRAWTLAGRRIRPCKKGPDYIDAAWLSLAADRSAVNLDPYIMDPACLPALLAWRGETMDAAVIEGNRGLFDGGDVTGSCSSAELARILAAPVVLVLDATKMTRTAAAIVAGLNNFEPNMRLAGVICNRTAGSRHRAMLTQAIEAYTDVPVLGMLPKLSANPIPERHMGLTSDRELDGVRARLDDLARVVADSLEMDALWELASNAGPIPEGPPLPWPEPVADFSDADRPRIGVVRDAALWFYYEENLEALRRAGAEVVEVSLLDPSPWPELHGLYLGGGFPETHAETLSASPHVRALEGSCEGGLPIYAECGGFMVLGRSLEDGERSHPMAGVFPVATTLCRRPQGLGYVHARVLKPSPYYQAGEELRGHEFHYSTCVEPPAGAGAPDYALRLERGSGMRAGHDGLVRESAFAAYSHIHALGVTQWAPRFVTASAAYLRARRT